MPYTISNMDSKKIFLWPVIISLVGHVALIAASSFVDLRKNVKAAEIFMVQITQSESVPEPQKDEKKVEEKKPPQPEKAKAIQPDISREDTVDLGSSDVKYADYLASVNAKIKRRWMSSNVYRNNDKGAVAILMTINADGSLAYVAMTSTSGSADVDRATLEVIQASAPFRPLPPKYDLSRLHITASFRYGSQ